MTPVNVKPVTSATKDRLFVAAQALAIVLCLAGCFLMLVIPTTSISIDSVYQGF